MHIHIYINIYIYMYICIYVYVACSHIYIYSLCIKVQFQGFAGLQGLGTLFCSLPVQKPGRLGKCLGNLGGNKANTCWNSFAAEALHNMFWGRLMQDQRS